MNSLKEWWKKNNKTLIFLIIGVDIFLLGLLLLLLPIFFIYLFILNIITLTLLIPLLFYLSLIKQQISPEDYYLKTVETNYNDMDDETILIKMFEIRISNLRQFLFGYLVLTATFTLAVTSNERIYNYFNTTTIIGVGSAKVIIATGIVGILLMVYYTFGVDRLTLKDLEVLFKAKEKLRQLRGGGIPSQTPEITDTIHQDNPANRIMPALDYEELKSVVDKAIRKCCICFNVMTLEESKYIQKVAENRLHETQDFFAAIILLIVTGGGFMTTIPLLGAILLIIGIAIFFLLYRPFRNAYETIILDAEERILSEERGIYKK